ncbi:Cytochrome P450, partial [Trinorchestia longiramus]
MLTFVLATVVLGAVCSLFFVRYQKVRLIEKIPGPPALPLLGNAVDLAGSHQQLFKTLVKFANIGDGISRIYIGLQPYCILSKPRTVETMLSSNVIIDKSADYDFLHPWLGTGLLTSTGQKFALLEEKMVLAHFLRAYEVKATQTIEELGLLGELVLRPGNGITVTINKRK